MEWKKSRSESHPAAGGSLFLLWGVLLARMCFCELSMRERLPAGRSFYSPKRTKTRLKRSYVSLKNLFLLLFVRGGFGASSSGSTAGMGVIRCRLILGVSWIGAQSGNISFGWQAESGKFSNVARLQSKERVIRENHRFSQIRIFGSFWRDIQRDFRLRVTFPQMVSRVNAEHNRPKPRRGLGRVAR